MELISRSVQRSHDPGSYSDKRGERPLKTGSQSPNQSPSKYPIFDKVQRVVGNQFGKLRPQRLTLMGKKKDHGSVSNGRNPVEEWSHRLTTDN